MAQKPITSSFTPPGPDRANIKSIEKNFNELYDSLKWKELLNTAFNVSITGTAFTLDKSWQELKDAYAEIYFCVISLDDKSHTIILPTDMIGKEHATAVFNLASSAGASMFVTLGGLSDKLGTVRSSVNGSTRLIILAR